jgi:hypothetical protein
MWHYLGIDRGLRVHHGDSRHSQCALTHTLAARVGPLLGSARPFQDRFAV